MDLSDRWIISKYNRLVKSDENLEKYELGIAVQKLYDFIWNEFCDWYIELVKPRLYEQGGSQKEAALYTLVYVLSNALKLLHPFMPFITEEIWQHLPHEGESIMISPWPEYKQEEVDAQAEDQMEAIMNAIKSIRNVRSEMDVLPSQRAQTIIIPSQGYREVFDRGEVYFEKLAYASKVILRKMKLIFLKIVFLLLRIKHRFLCLWRILLTSIRK